jgi:hypothetical protein
MFQQAQPFPKNCDNGLILPPLPVQAFRTEPIPSGPNPYALKSATQQQQQPHHQDKFYPQQPSMQRDSMYMPAPARQQPLPQTATANHFFNNNHSHHHHQHHHNNNNNNNAPQNYGNQNYDYRAERLEKQRQTVVGGSLFVTSPRSFLLGLRDTAVSNQ